WFLLRAGGDDDGPSGHTAVRRFESPRSVGPIDAVHMRLEPRVDPVMPHVAFQVGDHLVAGRPPRPWWERETGEVGHPPGAVQQEPVVATSPARADGLGPIEDHWADTVLPQRRRRGETRGAGTDSGDFSGGHRASR